jgi:hypothetical protein
MDSWLATALSTDDDDVVGRIIVGTNGGGVCDAPAGQVHCVFVRMVPGPSVVVMIHVEHFRLLVDSGGVDVAAGPGLLVDGGRALLLNVVLKPLATELASDKMLLQIAAYVESSENGTMLQASPERVVVVVAVAEQPFTIEQVMLPQLVVMVVPGATVFVTFHVEHDCVQTETEDEEHGLDVERCFAFQMASRSLKLECH